MICLNNINAKILALNVMVIRGKRMSPTSVTKTVQLFDLAPPRLHDY